MNEYIILGASHEYQHLPRFGVSVRNAIEKYAIMLVAEEWPLDAPSPAFIVSLHLHIPYLQIDMFPDEQRKARLSEELNRRPRFEQKGETFVCYRLSHADGVREDFWLSKMEPTEAIGRVLLICGFHHMNFLDEKMKAHGWHVAEKIYCPPELSHGVEVRALSPADLDKYWEDYGAASGR